MIDSADIDAKLLTVRSQLQDKFGVKSRSLQQALRRTGRRLPRRIRRQGRTLVAAERMAGNPRLARQMDRQAVAAAYDAVVAHLRDFDAADARKGRLISLASAIAMNILVVAAAFVCWMWWRGYV